MSTLSASLSASFVLALVGCSSSPVDPPVTRTMTAAETLAHLARFPEFAGHLGAGGALEASTQGFRLPKANALGSWTVLGGDALDVTLPKTAGEPTRIARADDADAWIELTTEGQRPGAPEVRGAALVLREVSAATDLVQVVEPSRFEEIRVLRTASAARATRYRVRRGPAIAALRVVDGRIEAVGADGRVRLAGAPSFAVDAHGTRRALETTLSADGATLALTLDPTGLVYPIAVDPLWTATPDLLTTRYKHGAAPLPDGRAMIAGGWRATGSVSVINTTFAFDGTAKTWTPLANMISPSDSFAFTVLSSGKLLVTGGNASGLPFRGASVYDPVANSWSSAGTFSGSPYQAGVVAALSGDRALAVSLPDALLWTLSTASFVAAGTTTVTHDGHTATTVTGDRVLVAGSSTSKETDLWDPTTKTFSNGGTMLVARANHTATLLPSGRVLFVGGTGLSTAELYDPATKKFSAAGAMTTVRTQHTATLLTGERLLVTGGTDGTGTVLSTTEIYDGATNTWSLAAPMSKPRVQHTATALTGSRVVVAGGYDGASTLSTAEVFEPYAKGIACAKNTDCATGFCTDGVCCDTACTGQCEACDATGSVGTCTAVAGAPHAPRTACVAAGTGVCARACDGKDRTQCNFGAKTVECSAATCASGSATAASTCDGAGNCPTPTKTDCAPYACGGTACKTSCAGDADCGGANVCDTKTGKCVVAVAFKCSADGLTSIPTDTSKPPVACAPYVCDTSTGQCPTRCATTRDCMSGNACDVPSGECKPLVTDTPTDSGGGCAYGGASSPVASALGLALVGLVGRRRRR
ncbi:MAG: hypothetical protein IPJ34_41100 [Myxococcales bacterium]|nr:hypothetical protein [Myxococcales bacterium]